MDGKSSMPRNQDTFNSQLAYQLLKTSLTVPFLTIGGLFVLQPENIFLKIIYFLVIFCPVSALSILAAPAIFASYLFMAFVEPLLSLAYVLFRQAIFPVRYANNFIEEKIISSSLDSWTALQAVNSLLYLEMAIESVMLHSLLFGNSPWYVQGCFGIYNLLQVNGWRSDRIENFRDLLVARRDFGRRAQQIQTRVEIVYQHVPVNNATDPIFKRAWKKAITTHDLTEVLDILQRQFAQSKRVRFTPEMQKSLDKNDDRLRNGLTTAELDKLQRTYPNLKTCPLTLTLMHCPVNLPSYNHAHYFEFTSLLKWLETNNVHPTTRQPITDLKTIQFAQQVYDETQIILEKTKDLWSVADRTNDYAPILAHLKTIAEESNDDAKTLLREHVNHITQAYSKYTNSKDNFFGRLISNSTIIKLNNDPANKNLLCEITRQFMRNPVYIDITNTDGVSTRHYYDLVPLLNWLMLSDQLPTNDNITQRLLIQEIHFDLDKQREIIDTLRECIVKTVLFSQQHTNKLGIETDDELSESEPENIQEILDQSSKPKHRRTRTRTNSGFS